MQNQKSDLGTVFVHWLIAFSLLGCIVTGLSIASGDNPKIWVVRWFGFLLPGENLWYYHLISGVGLVASMVAYAVYLKRARLGGRLVPRIPVVGAFLNSPARWILINSFLYWLLFGAVTLALGSGACLFFGYGWPVRLIHLHGTWLFLVFIFAHPLSHWISGGWSQLLRIVRPQWRLPPEEPPLVDALIERLHELEAEKARSGATGRSANPRVRGTAGTPLAVAAVAGIVAVFLSLFSEQETRQTLTVKRVSPQDAPPAGGPQSYTAWRRAPVTTVVTQHGANFAKGETKVEVRAVHDGTFVYFSFVWSDPAPSLMHMPLVKSKEGWHLLRSAGPGNETQIHEDKFSVLLAAGGQRLIGKGIHLGKRPLANKPESATGRGLHYIEGGAGEVWLWRASHGGMLGWIDHGHFGAPLPASAAASARRYTGGFSLDREPPYKDNFDVLSQDEAYPLVRPLRFPANAAGFVRLASLGLDPDNSGGQALPPWLTPPDSVPYSEETDRTVPAGTVIPGSLLFPDRMKSEGDLGPVGVAQWSAGRWCLEVRRRLDTGGAGDVAIKTGTLMWVAAFDHAETWHTYHVRPLELEVE
jgi:Ethylbenzene dehydrogenase/Prokaryotic cytochrome b561